MSGCRREMPESLRPVQLIAIIVTGAAATYAATTVGPLQEAMCSALGLTDTQVAVLQGPALALPPLVLGIPIGLVIDRVSRARLAVIFTALEILGTVLTALAWNFAVLLCARALVGSMLIGNGMNSSALLAEVVPEARRGRTLMILGVAQMAAAGLSFALGGEIVTLYGSDVESWRWTMLWLAVPLFVAMSLAFTIRAPFRETAPGVKGPRWSHALAVLWRLRSMFIPLAFGQVIVSMGYSGAFVWAVPILARTFKLLPNRSGAMIGAVLLVAGPLGSVLGGILADLCQRTGGLRRSVALMIMLAFLQIPTAFFGLMPHTSWLILLLGLMCTITVSESVVCTAATTIVMPEEYLGVSFGVLTAIAALFSSIAPLAVTQLAARLDGTQSLAWALCIMCTATSLIGAITFLVARPRFPGLRAETQSVSQVR